MDDINSVDRARIGTQSKQDRPVLIFIFIDLPPFGVLAFEMQ
jgi:hypothetical protein